MISNKIEEYEVLSILGADLTSTCYKVKSKETSQIFVWKAVSYKNLNDADTQALIARIEEQKLKDCPHLLKVYDYIIHEDTKLLYLINEFCTNGNLVEVVHRCLIENEYLEEEFLWQLLHQIASTLKIEKNLENISLSNVFLDAECNVKLFNENILKSPLKGSSICSIGPIMLELCTLQPSKLYVKNNVTVLKQILTHFPTYYSNELKEIIKFFFNINSETKSVVDAVLCHPTVLLKLRQPRKTNIFNKNLNAKNCEQKYIKENLSNTEVDLRYQSRLENVKNREVALKHREERFTVKEHELHKRERKVAIMERMVKEKTLQADLYLKRCREHKSTNSSSNKINSYETIDTSFSADCGDSVVLAPTSRKLIPENIKKPSGFIRTLSERKVRFKGHSPLKDMCTNRNNSKESVRAHLALIQETNSASGSNKSSKISSDNTSQKSTKSKKKLELFSTFSRRNGKQLVDQNVETDVQNEIFKFMSENCRPISWTEETKQQAFDLLRIMNQEESQPIKHTYL